ncbi:MAG: L-threonylcarbamoyladenylate synthase [Elusimicrobia bacterium]|jgi:L-threonylcarbamoyladenylate synthase|nr:L-threonylcarbamoyladenylate synthase [Elusimicrobiota bacterium]
MNEKIKEAAAAIKNGGVALFPTDTVCGLFACPDKEAAVKKIYTIKRRDRANPLAMLVPNIDSLWKWVKKDDFTEKKLRDNWPGAVTFILNTKEGKTIGVRMPDFNPLLKLLIMTGPLYATSANISGEPAPALVKDVVDSIKTKCDIIVDLEMKSRGKPSKVIDLTGEREKVVRE